MMSSLWKQFILPLVVALCGLGLAWWVDLSALPQTPVYEPFTYTLLAIGLYGSVYGIHRKQLGEQRAIVLRAITLGVLLKTLMIGGVFYLYSKQLSAFLLGLAVAQIDPLSVANLMQGKKHKLSERASTIMSAWASFDDPMTVLLSIYGLYFFLPHNGTTSLAALFLPFGWGLLQNLVFAGLALAISRLFANNERALLALLALCLVLAVSFKWMLGIAMIGLFVRPKIEKLPQIVSVAYYIALFLLGMLLINGIHWLAGLTLGLGAMLAQLVAGLLLTQKLPRDERLALAFAQQNGITAMILALLLEKDVPGAVAVVAPAILFINLGYFITNRLLNREQGEAGAS